MIWCIVYQLKLLNSGFLFLGTLLLLFCIYMYLLFVCLWILIIIICSIGKCCFWLITLTEKFSVDNLIMDVELINDMIILCFFRWELGLVCGLMWGNFVLEKEFCMDLCGFFPRHIKHCVEELVAHLEWLGFAVLPICLRHCRLNWWEQVSYFFSKLLTWIWLSTCISFVRVFGRTCENNFKHRQ